MLFEPVKIVFLTVVFGVLLMAFILYITDNFK